MKKAAAITIVVIGFTMLYISTARGIMGKISTVREDAPRYAWWGSHDADAGDLARMAYLERVSKFNKDSLDNNYSAAPQGQGKIDLYLWGDSYTEYIPDSCYYGIDSLHYGRRYRTNLFYSLDTAKVNILVIEISERYFREYFSNKWMYDNVKMVEPNSFTFLLPPASRRMAGLIPLQIDQLFNPYINQNLEYNLFTYNFLTPLRNLKAELNYYLFNRASGDVVISDDGKYLFLKETIEPNNIKSSYNPITDNELDQLSATVMDIYNHYRADGFDEVYFSIIPSKVSVLQPGSYNYLIPRMQQKMEGTVPFIDVYDTFSAKAELYYKTGDTHWNSRGGAVWLRNLNSILKEWEANAVNRDKQ